MKKRIVTILAFFLTNIIPSVMAADAVTVALEPDGYRVEGKSFDDAEQLASELRNGKIAEVFISPHTNASPTKLMELIDSLRRRGMKVGFVSAQPKQ